MASVAMSVARCTAGAKPFASALNSPRPFEVFSEVLAKLPSGRSLRNIDRGGTRDWLKNIRFCLLETTREKGTGLL